MKFDHDAIAADIQSDANLTNNEIAEKHGCSPGMVSNIKRKLKIGLSPDEKAPTNLLRANALRKHTEGFNRDFKLLTKWLPNDLDGKVAAIMQELEDAVEKMTTAAELYEALPAECMRRRGGGGGSRKISGDDVLPEGTLVSVREKYRDTYAGIVANVEGLRVLTIRERAVLVVDSAGTKLFIPKKELELMGDDGDEDDGEE